MFKQVNTEEFVVNVSEDGWYRLDLQYFQNHPEVARTVLANLRAAKTANRTLVKRYKRLNVSGRTLSQCPRKGVAVRQPSNQFYISWLNELIELFHEHYGDVEGSEDCPHDSADAVDHFVTGKHESFQLPKMGMFAPFSRNALSKSVSEFIRVNKVDNQDHIALSDTLLALKAMDRVLNEDLAEIPHGSLSCCSASEAVYGSNVQGLATGLIQLRRELTLSKDQAKELTKIYDFPFHEGMSVAEAIIILYVEKELEFNVAWNIVTNLKRVQVGGLDVNVAELPSKIGVEHFKKAKYRTISTNDPMIQIAEASAGIPFREAVKTKTSCVFYNTLLDPDYRWDRISHSQRVARQMGCTLFPFDFSLHDAHLHAEWLFNLMMRIVAPLFRDEDRSIIELTAICLVYKIYLAPSGRSGYTLQELVGSLGSGDPWTNIIGTLGTRTIGYILAEARPDIFTCTPEIGFNNGDDAAYGIKTGAIESYGIKAIIDIANDIVNRFHYYFNDSKLLLIKIPENQYVNHWEQYAIWYNALDDTVKRHGSTLRYFGKIYSDEDAGRQDSLEGLMDQLSTLNNTVGYVGNQTFSTTTFNLEALARFIEKDSILTSYVNKHGQAFFESLTKDAVAKQVAKLKAQAENEKLSDDELKAKAIDKTLHHLRVSGFDKSGLAKMVHDNDFSFLSVTKLVGLGAAELHRIAATGKGELLHYQVINGNLQWSSNIAA